MSFRANSLWGSWLESWFLRETLFQWICLIFKSYMLLTVRNKCCPWTSESVHAWAAHWHTPLAHPFCFYASSDLMHMQKNRPSRWTWSCSHSHLQTVWVGVTSTWAHGTTSNLESSTLLCHPANLCYFLLGSHNKKIPRKILVLFFQALLSAPSMFSKADYRNVYKSTKGWKIVSGKAAPES